MKENDKKIFELEQDKTLWTVNIPILVPFESGKIKD